MQDQIGTKTNDLLARHCVFASPPDTAVTAWVGCECQHPKRDSSLVQPVQDGLLLKFFQKLGRVPLVLELVSQHPRQARNLRLQIV